MSDQLVLDAELGRETGSAMTRRLRREGKVPGVVYGLGDDPTPVAVEYGGLRRALTGEAGLNALLSLNVGGDTQLCLVKELQRHPVRDEVIHVDFVRVDPNIEVEVSVPVLLTGEARQVTAENGMVDQAMFAITVYAKPDAIPNELSVDISELTVGDSIRVEALDLPAGVRTELDPDETIAVGTVTRSTLEAMAAEEAAEAAALLEGEEGAAPAGDGDDGGSDGDDAGDD